MGMLSEAEKNKSTVSEMAIIKIRIQKHVWSREPTGQDKM